MKVNEIFYSLQGEGKHTGVPVVFVRLSGCNMKCWFCDTLHEEGKEMSAQEIVANAKRYPTRHMVITGGEPLLQLNAELTTILHKEGYYVQIETNGTVPMAEGVDVDWITCSPKSFVKGNKPLPIRLQRIDELKIVYEGAGQDMNPWEAIEAKEYRLQPCDVKDEEQNQKIINETIDYLLKHPKWHLSLQTHKIINVQ